MVRPEKRSIQASPLRKDHKSDHYRKIVESLSMLQLVSTDSTEALNFNSYCLNKKSRNYDEHIPGEVARRIKFIELQLRSASFRPSDLILIQSFLHKFREACSGNNIHEGTFV